MSIRTKYALDKNFVKGPPIEASESAEARVVRFPTPMASVTKVSAEDGMEYFDFSLPIKDPKFEAFWATRNQAEGLGPSIKEKSEEFRTVYGQGFNIAQGMAGFSLDKQFGLSGAGFQKPVELKKYRYLGENLRERPDPNGAEGAEKKREAKLGVLRTRLERLQTPTIENLETARMLLEELVGHLTMDSPVAGKGTPEPLAVSFIKDIWDQTEARYLRKIDKSQESSKQLKKNIEILEHHKKNRQKIEEILETLDRFQEVAIRVGRSKDPSMDNLLVDTQTMIEIVRQFPREFFAFQTDFYAAKRVVEVFSAAQKNGFGDFFAQNVRETEFIFTFLRYLDSSLADFRGLEEAEARPEQGWVHFVANSAIWKPLESQLKISDDPLGEVRRVLGGPKEVAQTPDQFPNSHFLSQEIVELAHQHLIDLIPIFGVPNDFLLEFTPIFDQFRGKNHRRRRLSAAFRSYISHERHEMAILDLANALTVWAPRLDALDLRYLLCCVFIPRFLGALGSLGEDGLKTNLEAFSRLHPFLPPHLIESLEERYIIPAIQ